MFYTIFLHDAFSYLIFDILCLHRTICSISLHHGFFDFRYHGSSKTYPTILLFYLILIKKILSSIPFHACLCTLFFPLRCLGIVIHTIFFFDFLIIEKVHGSIPLHACLCTLFFPLFCLRIIIHSIFFFDRGLYPLHSVL